MFLIIGLGNPGEEYEYTRHNVGFLVVDELARRFDGITAKTDPGLNASYFKTKVNEDQLLCAKPLTFMNSSGRAVNNLLNYFKIDKSSLIVVQDDLDLDIGKLRIKKGGSSGGHLGIDSIINCIGVTDFYRVKIGIGRPNGRKKASSYVLEKFKKNEIESIEFAINQAADAILDLISVGLEATMNKYN